MSSATSSYKPTSRIVVLGFATIVGLSAGTNYLFSAYAPQLSSRLSLTSTQTNIVGAAGNLGVYLSGIPIGRAVDRRGPTLLLVFAAFALSSAYLTIRAIYLGGEDGLFHSLGVPGLALIEMLTGIGSTAALAAAGNSVAKSFRKTRATALSLVLSGFGLSAFFYSSIWRTFSRSSSDPTASLLLMLVIGCGGSMALGALTIRPVPHSTTSAIPPEVEAEASESDEEDIAAVDVEIPATERTPLVGNGGVSKAGEEPLNVSGSGLLKELDFWLLFLFNGLCSGCGLMYINNLGTLVRTLADPREDPPWNVALQQANLVSLLSVFNCIGRLSSGFLSDFMLHRAPEKWRFSRVWWNVSTAFTLLLAQLLVSHSTTVEGISTGLALPTIFVGFAHGSLFGLSGIIGLERFGMKNFSGNNGVLALAPAVFGQAANLMFGKIYDHQASRQHQSHALLAAQTCTAGKSCYISAFRVTTSMAILAMIVGFVLSSRKSMKRRAA